MSLHCSAFRLVVSPKRHNSPEPTALVLKGIYRECGDEGEGNPEVIGWWHD